MPPSRHSGSSMSAHKDSDQIPSDQNYTLGDYSFRIERTSVPGSTNDKIEAICTDKDGKNARKSIQIPSSAQIEGWYVEANETEATVYAVEKVPVGGDEKQGDFTTPGRWPQPVAIANSVETLYSASAYASYSISDGAIAFRVNESGSIRGGFFASANSEAKGSRMFISSHIKTEYSLRETYTHNGQTVYYYSGIGDVFEIPTGGVNLSQNVSRDNVGEAAWTAIFGVPTGGDEYETKQVIVGRFALDLEDAGGVGPGSDWIDPGDYDPDWEEGDPTHTLYVTVTGALSGRHNDPIEDPSYSYIPADKDTVKDYGCGGDGGHGGGGGAGASTVVVHKFATNQANSKEVIAIARRHGYGSGGGKGGKGGDGCILVYY